MRQSKMRIFRGLIAGILGLTLAILALGTLLLMTAPAQAHNKNSSTFSSQNRPEPLAVPPQQAGTVSIAKTATTMEAANGTIVANGGWVTYTITVQNNTGSVITDVQIVDFLPAATFEEGSIEPLGGFTHTLIQGTTVITDRDGNILATIVETQRISWPIASLASGQMVTRQFRARVICRADGSTFSNIAIVYYNDTESELSNQLVTQVQQATLPNAAGQLQVSNAPTWCSTEPGGAYDMDWADFDRDGDLDAALGFASFGARVYRNNGGNFAALSQVHSGFVYSVHWADVDNSGNALELVVVGPYECPPCFTGKNYVYRWDGSQFNQVNVFNSDDGVFRVAAADYDKNGNVDLATAVYWSGGGAGDCKVRVHRGNGGGVINHYNNASSICLVSGHGKAAWSLAWGDFDNNGFPDLAAGRTDGIIQVFPNSGVAPYLASATGITVASGLGAVVHDLAWGDYNRDGFLDLAAALDAKREVRIYRNNGAGGFDATPIIISTNSAIRAIDWVDINGDGRLELAVADDPPKLYDPTTPATPLMTLSVNSNGLYAIQGLDYDNDGDLDISVANLSDRSLLFNTFAPFLDTQLTVIDSSLPQATSVTWGDIDNDSDQDLLIGATSSVNQLRLNNNNETFSIANPPFLVNGRSAAFGNIDGDADLDIGFGRNGKNQIYLFPLGPPPLFPDWSSNPSYNTFSSLFADFDQDNQGLPELLNGNNGGPNTLYANQGLQTAGSDPVWLSLESDNTRQIAWGYLDSDILPDFAAANDGASTRVYRNTELLNFTAAINLPAGPARSVAWGDYDGDGDMDLAVGRFGQPNQLYQNNGGALSLVWTAAVSFNTTSVAWADWDSDGDLDLAVGNDGQPDQVYANLGSTPGSPKFSWLWKSQQSYTTQHIAWGDADGDGDLDLTIASSGATGYYKNNYALPANLNPSGGSFTKYIPLPHNPSYLSIARPGAPGQVFTRTNLSDPNSLVIPINFQVFDPDGTRSNVPANAAGDPVTVLNYQYSINGGPWQNASGASAYGGATSRQGVPGVFNWQAGNDLNTAAKTASDNVRFRITIAHINKSGPVQHASSSAVSPPFRVRNITCLWPENPGILMQPTPPVTAGSPIQFTGSIEQWSTGPITFTWDFGNNVITSGQIVQHTYPVEGAYVVTLTVRQPPCPVTRPDFLTATVLVGAQGPTGPLTGTVFLPIILKSAGSPIITTEQPETGIQTPAPEIGGAIFTLHHTAGSPAQISNLTGNNQSGTTALQWSPGPADQAILGYRIYRALAGTVAFQLLADVPANQTSYADNQGCGQSYFVTAYNAQGESLPSASSYFNPPCP